MNITIKVVQKDISNGVRGHCERCPIALAATRKLGCRVTVFFGLMIIHRNKGSVLRGTMPYNAGDFAFYFDTQGIGKPFEFEVKLAGWTR